MPQFAIAAVLFSSEASSPSPKKLARRLEQEKEVLAPRRHSPIAQQARAPRAAEQVFVRKSHGPAQASPPSWQRPASRCITCAAGARARRAARAGAVARSLGKTSAACLRSSAFMRRRDAARAPAAESPGQTLLKGAASLRLVAARQLTFSHLRRVEGLALQQRAERSKAPPTECTLFSAAAERFRDALLHPLGEEERSEAAFGLVRPPSESRLHLAPSPHPPPG